MDGQGLQAIRGEIEAIVTFQAALNRLALHVDENALSEWSGPRPEDVDGMAEDDGTFMRGELADVRKKAGEALAVRFREVAQVLEQRPELKPLLARTLAAGTGGVASLDGPEPGGVLAALSRTGSIRLDWAQAAANLVRDELTLKPEASAAPASATPAGSARRPATKKRAPATKKPAAKKKPAAAAKKAAPKTKQKKPAAPAKKVAPKKKKPATARKPARKPASTRSRR
jgi:hypothetical protein